MSFEFKRTETSDNNELTRTSSGVMHTSPRTASAARAPRHADSEVATRSLPKTAAPLGAVRCDVRTTLADVPVDNLRL